MTSHSRKAHQPGNTLLASVASSAISFGICMLLQSEAVAQMTQQTGSGSSSRRFGFTITNNYGVSITSNATPGYKVEGEGQMGILPGSSITNQSSSTGVTLRSDGITVTGVNAGLTLNLDPEKTYFRAKLQKIGDSPSDPVEQLSGGSTTATAGTASVSAVGSATTTFTVESSENVSNNIFTKVF